MSFVKTLYNLSLSIMNSYSLSGVNPTKSPTCISGNVLSVYFKTPINGCSLSILSLSCDLIGFTKQ